MPHKLQESMDVKSIHVPQASDNKGRACHQLWPGLCLLLRETEILLHE